MIMPKTYEQLKEEYPICRATFSKYIAELREEIRAGRYDPCILIDESPIRVSPLAFIDYAAHRKSLLDKRMRKYVPPFNPAEVKNNYPEAVDTEVVTQIVLNQLQIIQQQIAAGQI